MREATASGIYTAKDADLSIEKGHSYHQIKKFTSNLFWDSS
jgi:hypothetical protein